MSDNQKISRLLSKALRHEPEVLNIKLDQAGWTSTSVLISNLKKIGYDIDLTSLEFIVDNNDKKRFTLSSDKKKIRAAQGHSVAIDLQLAAKKPPHTLFHGTATHNLASIFRDGLISGSRQHVHLSKDQETALKVGSRHGRPMILKVAAAQAFDDGVEFYEADNGVWLTKALPKAYISF